MKKSRTKRGYYRMMPSEGYEIFNMLDYGIAYENISEAKPTSHHKDYYPLLCNGKIYNVFPNKGLYDYRLLIMNWIIQKEEEGFEVKLDETFLWDEKNPINQFEGDSKIDLHIVYCTIPNFADKNKDLIIFNFLCNQKEEIFNLKALGY